MKRPIKTPLPLWLIALALAGGLTPPTALAVDLTGGVRALFKDHPGTNRDKMKVVFRQEAGLAAPIPDPTDLDSSLTVRWRTGGTVTTAGPTPLARSGWTRRSQRELYVYRDAGLLGGKDEIRIYSDAGGTRGGLVVKAKGPRYGAQPVAGPVDWVEVELAIGSETYCGRFTPAASDLRRNEPSKVLFRRGSTACQSAPAPDIRVPAEWEEQEAVWLQWPGAFEKAYEPAYADMSTIIMQYQKLHILHDSNLIRVQARAAILSAGGDPDSPNVSWHAIPNDNAWMRDNGPTYVVQDGQMRIQDWGFDAWGGGFGPGVPYAADDVVPIAVGALTGLPVDDVPIVHERGNLEFNGADAVILNWSVIGDPQRNPGYTKAQAIADMKRYFGVSRVVLTEGFSPSDGTRGHIDGIARFIDPNTVVVGQCTAGSVCQPGDSEADVFDDAAAEIAAAGFTVIREPFEGKVLYNGAWYDTDYMNWLVGNGFVIAVGFGDPSLNANARARLETYYPNRTVYVIDMLPSWEAGGGAHCHTNDQPAASTTLGYTPWTP